MEDEKKVVDLSFESTADSNAEGGADSDSEQEVARLASLTEIEYETERAATAKRLGLRLSILDELVGRKRSECQPNPGDASDLLPAEPEPWPDEVYGPELLGEATRLIKRHLIADDSTIITVSIWSLGTHLFRSFSIFPRLTVTSPQKRCGKTTLLDILAELVSRPLIAANMSSAVLFRVINDLSPTLLIDEADRFLKKNDELIGILNAGHNKNGSVLRNVPVGKNDWDVRRFQVYAPVVISGIGDIPDTLADRSVFAILRRKLKSEHADRLRTDRTGDFLQLKRKMIRWAIDNAEKAFQIDPEVPEQLHNRAADNWRPLLAIAELIGDEWCAQVRQVALSSGKELEDDAPGPMLLADIRQMFEAQGCDELFTKEILMALHKMEHRPWPEWGRGEPISPRGLAKLLRPFKIYPGTVRRGERTDKGYKRLAMNDAFSRYL